MKNKTAKLLKQIIASLTLMAKSKTMVLKSKVNAIKARLIILSLMKNKKLLMSSISDRFHSIWGNHSHHHSKEDCLIEEGVNCEDHHRAMVIFNNNARTYGALQNPSETQVLDEQDQEDYYEDDDDDDKYPDLTHSLFDSEGLDFGGSVIDRVKNCKEEAGKEFKLEDDIDEVADLFIRRFRRNIILQKQDSLKRKREIAQNECLSLKALDPAKPIISSVANSNQKNDIPQTVSIKLDRDNYPLWKSLVLPLIRGCKLNGYMLETKECPEQFVTSADSTKKINPNYEDWKALDQALLGWPISYMAVDITTQLLHCETSKKLWDEAQSLAGAHTRSIIIYLKSEFHNTRKGEMKLEQYFAKMKNFADKLKLAGSPISSSDLMIQTLNGLDSKYNQVIVKLFDQINLSWVDLQAQLLDFESRLDQINNFSNINLNASVNIVISEKGGNKFGSRGNWRGSSSRGMRGGRGRGRMSKPTCQEKNYAEGENQGTHSAFIASPYHGQDYDWYFDNRASNHVTHQTGKIQDLTESNGKNSLLVGNGNKLKIIASGSTKLSNLNLYDVLNVPEITKHLLSISKLTADNNILVEFDANYCFVKDKLTWKTLLKGKLKNGLYQLSDVSPQINKDSCIYMRVKENWHKKLGYPNNKVLEKVLKDCNVKISSSDNFIFCEACQFGKLYLLPFKSSSSHASEILDLIYTDVWGPAPILSPSRFKYYVHLIDDFSRFTWIFPLKQKSETIYAFSQFKAMVENQFNKKIKIIQCDGGDEYKPVQKIAKKSGILCRMSCPYTSQKNGRAERKHRHISALGLTLLEQAKMPLH